MKFEKLMLGLVAAADIAIAAEGTIFSLAEVKLAEQNRLHDPAVLEAQVKRMLADPKSDELVLNFAGQWLQLRALSATAPVADLYPDFDDNLRAAYQKEVEMFFASIAREDRSVLDLPDAERRAS